jgi:hypothetical protein
VQDSNYWITELAGAAGVLEFCPGKATPADFDKLAAIPPEGWAGRAGAARKVLRTVLAGPLANLSALSEMAQAGERVELCDIAKLVRSLNRELHRAGLESIGRVGEAVPFDVACHQQMSGGSVPAGTTATVQLPGYRLGEKTLLKAMVTTALDAPREEEKHG